MARQKKIPTNKINLTLLNSLQDTSDVFNQRIKMLKIPLYVKSNLKHNLRNYQFAALQNLDAVEHMRKNSEDYNQLMFYMATGSGKTDIMAATILYMYHKWNYQCFLFTTNTTAVVDKTLDNMARDTSSKYLFNDPIVIEGQRIDIKPVPDFPNVLEANTIYIKFISIQQLSNDYYTPRENGITQKTLAKHKMVILADEAHHFNVGTRSKEDKTNASWENLLDQIRNANSENQQLEFTATIDLHNPDIYHKYQNKIIAQYDLSRFINDGYSKEVYRLQANNSDEDKMLNAVLLSQYRKRLAYDMDIPNFKPIILFKSNTIRVSKQASVTFRRMIDDLTAESLQMFVQNQSHSTQSEALSMAYDYWLKQDFGKTVSEIKHDFSEYTTINVNDSAQKSILYDASLSKKLNTLESPDNPIRAIFAVAKLSEGWDVLNLYDIVRIGERHIGPNETNAEAQLIGRGARYNPFVYQGKTSFARRFDNAEPSKQLLERLYYHTINNPQYLKNLRKSLDAIDLPVNDDTHLQTFTAHVKTSFKRTSAYKHGNIYYNKVETIPASHYNSIQKYGFDPDTTEPIDMTGVSQEQTINSDIEEYNNATKELKYIAAFDNPKDKALIRTAMSYNDFYRFDQLKKQCPAIKSIKEFLTSDRWLGHARIQVRVVRGTDLTPQQKLVAVERYLTRVQSALINNFQRDKGTNQFLPVKVNEVIKDYQKRVRIPFNTEIKNSKSAIIRPYPLPNQKWYAFDCAIVDELEYDFIQQIESKMPEFMRKYKEVFLLRIDEQNTDFKLHDFGEKVYHYDGYMPDFIMYLQGADFIYQIYMEPKGLAYVERDRWKEELLKRIDPSNIDVLGNDEVQLYGVRFYIENKKVGLKDLHHLFSELKEKKLI